MWALPGWEIMAMNSTLRSFEAGSRVIAAHPFSALLRATVGDSFGLSAHGARIE
jgi:hypothetical protein